MPGPEFGTGQNIAGWIKKHYRKIVFAAVIVFLAAGANYFYQSYQARTALLKPVLDQITVNPSGPSSTPNAAVEKVKGTASLAPAAEKNNGRITVAAAKGNGPTHLARRALKEYVKDKPELAQKLGAEQRIYIEDYLSKHLGSQPKDLHPGDRLSFSDSDIQNAITGALALTDSQIKNLSRYVPLVPSLMTV